MYLTRKIESQIIKWIGKQEKKPLVICGSRQCGKTTTVKEITNRYYKNVYYINLAASTNAKYVEQLKQEPSLEQLLNIVGDIYHNPVFNNESVLIIDEIQEVMPLYSELKTFNETRKDINLIVMGSYLGMKVFTDDIFIPVGQTMQLEMFSMSFDEYLLNANQSLYNTLLEQYLNKNIKPSTHAMVLKHFNNYLITGGFPEVVKTFIANNMNFNDDIYELRSAILDSYENDIYRYLNDSDKVRAANIFNHALKTMGLENNNFALSVMNKCARFKEYEFVISLLEKAHICFKVDNSENIHYPLSPKDRVNKFKLYFNDISLISSSNNLKREHIDSKDYDLIKGNLIENFVLLELLRNGIKPYFHTFKYNNNQYEIDGLYEKDLKIKIIEIKSGKNKRSPSVNILQSLDTNVDCLKLTMDKKIDEQSLPLYLSFTLTK